MFTLKFIKTLETYKEAGVGKYLKFHKSPNTHKVNPAVPTSKAVFL